MSQGKKNRPPERKVTGRSRPQYEEDFTEEDEQYYEPRRASQRGQQYTQSYAKDGYGPRRTAQRKQEYRSRDVPPRRDMFPMLLGGIVGALVVGLMVAVFLLATRSGGTTPPSTTTGSNPGSSSSTNQNSQASGGEPPRIPLEDFMKLYNDPAKRPLIVDVRAKDQYDQGHIKGAVSDPVAEIGAWAAKLPKDKLIVAYCQ